MTQNKVALYDLELEELGTLLASWGERPEQARDVWQWLYRRQASGFDQMTTLPKKLQKRLAAETALCVPQVLARQEDPNGETRKDLLQLADGEQIEVVLLRYRDRRSACISTQVGCACDCPFCATGQMGFVRQLSCAEIVAQVLHVQRELAAQQEPGQDEWPALSNVVLMGMGEPLLNYDNTIAAVRRLIDQRAIGLPPGRVTLSTVGIAPGIERLAKENLPIKLAISLHAATDDLRDCLVPINQRYPLSELLAAARRYAANTRVMFEWLLINDVNDTQEQTEALVKLLKGVPAHVNLIRLNPTSDYAGRPSTPESIAAFTAALDRAGIPHTMRQRRGAEIEAGCGQLRSRETQIRRKGG